MMSSSTKFFFIAVILLIVSIFFIYKGVEEEALKRAEQQSISSPSPISDEVASSPDILGEVTYETTQSAQINQEGVLVNKVIDGDTIEVVINNELKRIRLIGVDTPETVDPNRPKGCFGSEASNETKKWLSGKKVILEKDVSETDKYQRLLRYVRVPLEDGRLLFINDYLVREGFAQVLTYPPDVKYNDRFLEAQRIAKEQKKGLWGICN